MKVFITYRIPEAGLAKLRDQVDLQVNEEERFLSKEELIERMGGIEGLGCVLQKVDKELMDAAKELKIIANFGVGYNNIDVDYATSKGIMVTNTPGVLTETTADMTWAILMAVARRVVEADHFTRSGQWTQPKPDLLLGSDVHGKVLGIIGLGRIGQAVARRAIGFGMTILYHDVQRAAPAVEQSCKATYTELDTLVEASDFVTLHVPLMEATHHLMDTRRLSRMKRSAFLVNASRGAVVDEKALVKALQERRIAGAALDVYEEEPHLSQGLTDLDNVVLMPHLGSATRDTRDAMAELVADNLLAAAAGQTPPNLVNKEGLRL